MPATDISTLPDDARIWIFGTDGELDADVREALLAAADDHLASWHAHGAAITGARSWIEDRFLVIAADERSSGVSGCSIDRLFSVLGELEGRFGVGLRDAGRVWYRAPDGGIRTTSRPGFAALAEEGAISAATPVFDPTIRTLGELRAGRFEIPLGESWHARAFRVRERQ